MRIMLTLITSFLIFLSPIASAEHNFGPVDMGSFYVSLPALGPDDKLGTLLISEQIDTPIQGVQAWRIGYVSSDAGGHKTVVTGIVAAPVGLGPSTGRPIVAWAHGTTGTAQNCGPSQLINPVQPLNQYFSPTGNAWTDFGLPAMAAFIKAGYVIVATDYQGLGGGGKHQYTVSVTQAHDVIDSIRAVTQIPNAGAGTKAVVYGWSQGGGAALTTASSMDYLNTKGTAKDGIDIIGVVALAPYDIAVTIPPKISTDADASKFLQQLAAQFSANIFNFTHYAQNLWGMVAAFPQLELTDMFTPEGAKMVDTIMQRKCMHVVTDTFNYVYGNDYKKLLRSDIKNPLLWLDADKKGSVPPKKPMAPVIIYWGNHDTTVPPIMGQLYYEQMCKLGGNITRVQLPGDQTHISTPASAEPFYVKWVADRFAGLPATNGCKSK